MFGFIKFKSILVVMIFLSSALMANSHDFVCAKGGGTYFFPNTANGLLNEKVSRFSIKTKGNSIEKGKFFISSDAATPFDSINGLAVETKGTIDSLRVFEEHPDIVWLHGILIGTLRYGTNPVYGVNAGQLITLNASNGEFIGAISKWGRTDFLSVFENGGVPLPDFATATEEELNTLVQGFSGILLTNGAKPGRLDIKTSGNTFIIGN